MAFIIVGGGRVGLRTARTLHEEGYEVVIVEEDPEKADRIRDEGFRVVQGNAADAEVLEQAGIETADVVAGLTDDLNTNFAACMIGAEYGCRTVLRIDEDYRKEIYEKYADEVDEIVYPEQLGAAGAKTALLGGDFNLLADLTEELQLFIVNIPENSPVIGRFVSEINSLIDDNKARIYAHGHERKSLELPLPGTTIEPHDRVAVIAEREMVETVKTTLLGDEINDPAGQPNSAWQNSIFNMTWDDLFTEAEQYPVTISAISRALTDERDADK